MKMTRKDIDYVALTLSLMILTAMVITAFVTPAFFTSMISSAADWSETHFGLLWQIMMPVNFIICLVLAFYKTGKVKLGGDTPVELSNFKWLAIVMSTLLAGGGVFWAVAEPIAHFSAAPPSFGGENADYQRAIDALSQSFFHWGFFAWSILGALSTITLMHLHHVKGLPLKPRTLLYPVLGRFALSPVIGGIVDGLCIVSVAAGTIGPIGFLGLQVGFVLHQKFQLGDTFLLQASVIVAAIIIYSISVVSGIQRGIQLLSRFNVILALVLLAFIIIAGPTVFILKSYLLGLKGMVTHLPSLSFYDVTSNWMKNWTLFFWAWFIGFAPVMSIFIARISRGRSIRELVIVLCLFAPIVTNLWFAVMGGVGLHAEMHSAGSISQAYQQHGLAATLVATLTSLPLSSILIPLFLILSAIFIITTSDSITYSISVMIESSQNPSTPTKLLWAVMMGVLALILIYMGSGSVSAFQAFIIFTATPVSLLILPCFFYAPYVVFQSRKD